MAQVLFKLANVPVGLPRWQIYRRSWHMHWSDWIRRVWRDGSLWMQEALWDWWVQVTNLKPCRGCCYQRKCRPTRRLRKLRLSLTTQEEQHQLYLCWCQQEISRGDFSTELIAFGLRQRSATSRSFHTCLVRSRRKIDRNIPSWEYCGDFGIKIEEAD